MDAFIDFLINWGYWGMLAASFLAGSFFPFSSEAVMLGLFAAGLKPWPLIIYGTVGNVMGGIFNYGIGRMGNLQWIERHLHVKEKDINKAKKFMGNKGAWMGFFAFLPILGSAITIVLGLMRANFLISTISITMGKLLRYIILVMSVASLTSCTNKPATEENNKIITVTIEPLRYFTEQIAGKEYKVVTMVSNGNNPETYEPTPKQMMELSKSALYIKVGEIGFERTWMKKLEANAPHTIIVNSSEGISPAESNPGIKDPHTWMSATNAIIIAKNIYKALAETNLKDSLTFKKNLSKLIEKINNTNIKVKRNIRKDKNLSFLIYHPSLTYFARDYNLKQIPVEEEGREPSAAQLKEVIKKARNNNVRVMFVQKEFSNRNTDIVSKGSNAIKEEINPLDYNWDKQMIKIATLLK